MHSARLVVAVLVVSAMTACGDDVSGIGRSAAGSPRLASGTVATGADLQVTGSSNAGSPTVNTAFTYTYQVKNAGPDSALNVTFTDTLLSGSIATAVATDNGAPCVTTGPLVVCNLGSIKKGAQTTIFMTAGAFTPGTLSNTGVAASSVTDPVSTNNSATVAVKVVSASPAGGKVLPTVVTAYSSLPAVVLGGAYNIVGLGDALGFQFTAAQSGGWQGVFASLHGSGLAGRGVCWMMSDDANNPDHPGSLMGTTGSVGIPATAGAITFLPAPQTTTPIPVVAGQKYWLFCRGLANQTWGGGWDFSADFTLRGLVATGSGSIAFTSGTTGPMPAFQVTVSQ
jgi:uncharacterized repeat protein (TIGR01451 family)